MSNFSKQKIQLKKKRLLSFVLVLIIVLFPSGITASAEDGNSQEKTLSGSFLTCDHIYSWEYVYSDDYFSLPSDTYHHDLARLSLGLALSAFRDTDHSDAQDDNLTAFFSQAGFEKIDTHTYQEEPSSDSVTYGFAQKKIGDATVIACAVCGGNYTAEWANNLTIGDEALAKGFTDSAHKVEEGLASYLEKNPIEGEGKLWIAGFSRGGAVSNVAAAECTDSGRFHDVYAYTFATPRTTKDPKAYRNIYNIIGKDDTVPKIPLADWGYRRYGTDLYLFSPLMNPDAEELVKETADLYRELKGSEMVLNQEISSQIRTIMDYLLLLFPDTSVYTNLLQPVLVDIISESEETPDAIRVLMDALEHFHDSGELEESELNTLLDYLLTIFSYYYLSGQIYELPPIEWDQELGTINLFEEHLPFKYLCKMFVSDDPEELFSDNREYIRLVIYGNANAQILDGKTVVKTVQGGAEYVDGEENPYAYPDVDCSKNKIEISLSADRSYTIDLTSNSVLPQIVSYTGNLYTGDTVRAETDDFYSDNLLPRGTMRITTPGEGRAIDPERSDYMKALSGLGSVYSPSVAMYLENNEIAVLTIPGLVTRLLLVLFFLLIQLIVSIVLAIIRKKRKTEKKPVVSAVWHAVNVSLFTFIALSMWYFIPVIRLLMVIPMVLSSIVLLVFAWKQYRRNGTPEMLKRFFIYVALLVAFVVLTALFGGKVNLLKAVLFVALTAAFFMAALLAFRGNAHQDRSGRLPTSPSK